MILLLTKIFRKQDDPRKSPIPGIHKPLITAATSRTRLLQKIVTLPGDVQWNCPMFEGN